MTLTDDAMLPLLDRYLAGECSAAEVAEVRNWLAADQDEHDLLVADIRKVRDIAKLRPPVHGVEFAWRRAVQQMELDNQHVKETRDVLTLPVREQRAKPRHGLVPHILRWVTSKERPMPLVVWPAAAVLVLGAFIMTIGWTAGVRRVNHRASTSMLMYSTGNGERATITLPDGVTVALNVASRLDVPLDYMAGNHTVRLVGEGLFTVPHNERTPFVVLAGGVTTRVLGTSFLVRHYTSDTAAVVAVREGKVAVGSSVVTANRLVEVRHNDVPSFRPADASLFTFATGNLTLNGMPLPTALVELDRWYDADIRLGDPALEKRHVKGVFGAGSLGELVEILELMYDVRVVRDGRVLTLYPRL